MSLTVKEKEHWKDRIARRIDHAIEELQATERPRFLTKRICEQKADDAVVGLAWFERTSRRGA